MNAEAAALIAQLGLALLPHEGGFFRETWRATETLANGRIAGGAIYFLMTSADFSALHRLRIAELWHFYAGDPLQHLQLGPVAGASAVTTLGSDLALGQVPQLVVPAGVWQGARPRSGGLRGWTLVGTTTSPAWIETDFELGERAALTRDFPMHGAIIAALTR